MEIALLGPMVVGGRDDLQWRDRTVLGVLVVRAGSTVPVDELFDALWPEGPPPSARKVVQGSVVRLRRILGPATIHTRDGGYALQLRDADTDAGRLLTLVVEARRQLEASFGERAAIAAREALDLWRGDPLPELERWPPATAEGTRLTALRDDAQDVWVEGLLLAGRVQEAVSVVAPLAESTPLRAPRWALWAQALHGAGRQADALEVLARLRATLADELGIDPSPQVADLEVAILRQDPALDVPLSVAGDAPSPWPGLLAYQPGDALFGRDDDIAAALTRLEQARALVLVGRSGVGKSSLARAGLAPRLSAAVVTPGPAPMAALTDVSTQDVVVDQAEELLTQCVDAAERREFLSRLSTWPGRVVVVVRADLLVELASDETFAALLERGLYVLLPLDEHGVRRAVEGPAEGAGVRLEPGLVDLLLAECRDQPGSLPLLSHVLAQMWRRIEGNTLTIAAYGAVGGIRSCLADTAEDLYRGLHRAGREEMRRLFRRLVTTDQGDVVRSRVPRGVVDPVLTEALVAARLVSIADDGSLQVAHEALVDHWPRLADWCAEDVAGQRLLRHLSAEAAEWEAAERPDDSLYRGLRLDAATAWAAVHDDELTLTERAFMAASREAADAEVRRARATSTRLRSALAAALVLLVASVAGAGYAVHQERKAEDARDAARRAGSLSEGLRLSETARSQSNPSVALALAAQALEADDSQETRVRVLETFDTFSALVSTGEPPPTPWPLDRATTLSPDGTLRAAATLTHVEIRDADTGEVIRKLTAPSNAPTALAFSPDGRLVVAGMSELGFAGTGLTVVWDVETGLEVGRFDSGDGAVRAHVFAADGSSVWSTGQDGVHRWDLSGAHAVARTQFGEPTTYRAGDKVLSLWDPSIRAWVDLACRLAGRPLTPAEWREHVGTRSYRPTCG